MSRRVPAVLRVGLLIILLALVVWGWSLPREVQFGSGVNARRAFSVEEARTRGAIEGKVVDLETGLPLQGVQVYVYQDGPTSDYVSDRTGASGEFGLALLAPGVVTVDIDRADLLAQRQNVAVEAGKTTRLIVKLANAPPPCCQLAGKWRVELTIDPGMPSNVSASTISGTVRFRSGLWARVTAPSDPDKVLYQEYGSFHIDWRPFLGYWTTEVANDVYAPDNGWMAAYMFNDAAGTVLSGDRVDMIFQGGLSHHRISLSGTIDKDGILRGSWCNMGFTCSSTGNFVMTRM
ncbi:carboxypeptidase regulatory-like domain-containing protein [Massilia violaceinigra]|uniref:Carboxypeptidase regulatory-like domain-containing protein n=1 Tax=Massilia violaceinigra TaxID=2045208 RepID=A0ABY4AHA0_9BURK|nr:carboxypeptidase-like regulatory domain-containing protein [Massilia violaceinigra]UOD32936.1 carboxypeptidase regulatory-like domain-containing protein [Massilia violaceinigra]